MQSRGCAATLVAAVLFAAPFSAGAEEVDYFAAKPDSQSVTIKRSKPRTSTQRLQIGGALALGALLAGVGVYFHLDSRDAASAVSGGGVLDGKAWTADRQATYDQARTSGYYAGLSYGLSALCLGGAAVIAWMTRPGEEALVIKPGERSAQPVIAPVPGGALVGGTWSW